MDRAFWISLALLPAVALAQFGGAPGLDLADTFKSWILYIGGALLFVGLVVVLVVMAPTVLSELFTAWKTQGLTGLVITIAVFALIAFLAVIFYAVYKNFFGGGGGGASPVGI